ncbi:MAG: NAD(P)/FAD-dependent oxidoreductase [Pseudanabaenaceae cyanobacterium]
MQQLLYREVPTPDTQAVLEWLWHSYTPPVGKKIRTTSGCLLEDGNAQLSVFLWSVQRSTYLKVFRWSQTQYREEKRVVQALDRQIREAFPFRFPQLPMRSGRSIFADLEASYPRTVAYFQKFPQGEFDLERVYWWEKRWRQICASTNSAWGKLTRSPGREGEVLVRTDDTVEPEYDLICVGGALGAIHSAMMAKLGYRVCVIERLPFARMNREWNISRSELQRLVDIGLFTEAELEAVIAREYKDGFHKFFDGNNPPHLRSPVLHTPTVLNIAIDAQKLLALCGDKLQQHGAVILDRTEFQRAVVGEGGVVVYGRQGETELKVTGRLLIDAMGSASPIVAQINAGRPFDSVCPTVGAVLRGLDPVVWDCDYGDVLNSHGDISRGRQLIWELFPGRDDEITIYLFHYHHIHPANPGSLLEMYEDFFTILPEYRRCDPDRLTWIKPTFGYIPGYYSLSRESRVVSHDRVLAIGDAAALQSPLVFTGFGSLVRNLPRLTELLDRALREDLLGAEFLQEINAFQSNVAVTWLFSRGMMVPTESLLREPLPPQRINTILNTFFAVMAESKPEVSDRFIKDRVDWLTFNSLALKAAYKNPLLVLWIWQMVGTKDILRWLRSYWEFTWSALLNWLCRPWLPALVQNLPDWLRKRFIRSWWRLLCWSYELTRL